MSGEVSKKVLWIFVFLILAAIAILGVLFIRGYQSGRQISSVESAVEPSTNQTTVGALEIALTEPNKDIATSSARITLAGKTNASAMVSAASAADDMIVQAGTDGLFTIPMNLAEGANIIILTAFADDGEKAEVKRNIFYTKGGL